MPRLPYAVGMKRLLALLVLTALSAAAQGQTFTVGGAGGQFAQIQEAIDSPLVPAGATLMVAPGGYASISVTKSLNILSDSGGAFFVGAVSIGPVTDFALVGARVNTLVVKGVTGRSLIEGCTFSKGPAVLEDCTELLVQRSQFWGQSACYPDGPVLEATGAADVRNARIVFTDCYFEGGDMVDEYPLDPELECAEHYPVAGNPLVISEKSEVVLAGCSLRGYGYPPPFWNPGPPAVLVSDSRVTIRGNQNHEMRTNTPEIVQMDTLSTLKVSGVTLVASGISVGQAGLPPAAQVPAIPEPFLVLGGGVRPGDAIVFELFAPAGAIIINGISLGEGLLSYPLGSEAFWIDPSLIWQLSLLIGQGHQAPATLPATLPATPTLAGLKVGVQSLVVDGQNAWLTNPLQLVLGA